jgi:hypothetical protein
MPSVNAGGLETISAKAGSSNFAYEILAADKFCRYTADSVSGSTTVARRGVRLSQPVRSEIPASCLLLGQCSILIPSKPVIIELRTEWKLPISSRERNLLKFLSMAATIEVFDKTRLLQPYCEDELGLNEPDRM